MGWKDKKKKSGSDIDFDYIAGQVKTGLAVATISGIIDLGEQDGGYYLDETGITVFNTSEEAFDFLDFITDEPSLGQRVIDEHDLEEVEEEEEIFRLPFNVVKKRWVFVDGGSGENVSYFPNERKAQKALDDAIKIQEGNVSKASSAAKKYQQADLEALKEMEVERLEDVFVVNCSVKKMDDVRQAAMWVDITDNVVEYIEGDEDSQRQYRIPLNPPFKTHVSGFKLTTDKDDILSAKALVDLIKACGEGGIIDKDSDDEGDLGLLIGKSFQTQVVGNNGFFKVKGRLPLPDGTEVEPLTATPMVVSFDDEPEEIAKQIKGFYLQNVYKDVIKKANDYPGSNMEKAFAILEGGDADTSEKVSGSDSGGDEEEVVSKRKVVRKERTESSDEVVEDKPKVERGRPAKKEVVEPDVDFDDDIPF